jgi:predicted transcriptional regulator
MKNVPESEWLRQSRKRLRLSQSDVAAALTIRLKKSVNQARIAEIESGDSAVPTDMVHVLQSFFRQVEVLRRQGRAWQDMFRN